MDSKITESQVKRALLASMTSLYFNGVIFSTWGVKIPIVKDKFYLSDNTLSLLLAAVAIGGIVALSAASKIITRTGSRTGATLSGIVMAICASFILVVPQFPQLLILMILFGVFAAVNDITVNTQVALLERSTGRSLIGALHASFSAGGLTGALLASNWTITGLAEVINFYSISVAGIVALVISSKYMISLKVENLSDENNRSLIFEKKTSAKTIAKKRLIVIGSLAFAALVIEGAFYDWSAIYMRDVIKAPENWVGYGYAAFSIGLVVGRLSGDWLRERFAHQSIIIMGWMIASTGIAIALFISTPTPAVLGFLLTGIGISNILPLLFSTSAKLATNSGMLASEGLAVTTRIAYVGLLAGPLIIGPVAKVIGLRNSMLTLGLALALACAGWLFLSRRTKGLPWVVKGNE
ncbi:MULTISPECIES: MFS transporter [unclassified Pantoea]|uniref:MFS transporter n=1 Tax=unclassified Pantoea TaxID=2630326 RepID=UPI001CD7D0D3|nr:MULTISPECIES: MFS transporter [unclassified Pantoea]MCA1179490.1 MFS transporter [Pantoea sp. alder69]MCA1251743.1 MFS transporter [Pantoea sp. alder70]MCA1267920.1 MFS transporter [Pantoea sp. alder81]